MHQGPRALSRTARCRVRTTVVAPVSRLTALARRPHGQFAWATRSPATAQPREAAIAGGSNATAVELYRSAHRSRWACEADLHADLDKLDR